MIDHVLIKREKERKPMLNYRQNIRFTWRSRSRSPNAARENVLAAAVIGSIYGITGISAWFYPGSMGIDPEFGPDNFPQKWVFSLPLILHWTGYLIEVKRIERMKSKLP
jgi:hypothetical protein